jgi:hypothetical protein
LSHPKKLILLIIDDIVFVQLEMKTMRFSASHDGFAIYLSRLLRPIWSQPILEKRVKQEKEGDADYNTKAKPQSTQYAIFSFLFF